MNATTMRETQINIRLNEEEHARFKRVADLHGLTIPGAIRLLMQRADEEIGARGRKAWLAAEPQWERDKKLVAWFAQKSNARVEIRPNDVTRTFVIAQGRPFPENPTPPLTPDQAIEMLSTWPKGDILMVDPHALVVTYSPSRSGRVEVAEPPEDALDATRLEALRRWRQRQKDDAAASDQGAKPKKRVPR